MLSGENKDLCVLSDEQLETLKKESSEIISQMVTETDLSKTEQLIAKFNLNQKRKTMARAEKIGELLDTITNQTIERFVNRPNEITTSEMVNALKVAQDISDKHQKQLNDKDDAPLIQINQQNNDINLGGGKQLSSDSKNKVKAAVENILKSIGEQQKEAEEEESEQTETADVVVEATYEEVEDSEE